MTNLVLFANYLTGEFDNMEQWEGLTDVEKTTFPQARHCNHIVNDKINGLSYQNKFYVLEESYYTMGGQTSAQPHLFCFAENEEGDIVLTSYNITKEYPKENMMYEKFELNAEDISLSEKFNPLTYTYKDGTFFGESESMLSPVLKFVLKEEISDEKLVIQESMWKNGKRIFGINQPIIYKRK